MRRGMKNILVRHRPRRFADLRGNDGIKQTIANMLRTGSIPAGFALTGHPGCGKTTLAYLIIRRLRCEVATPEDLEPCLACDGCDVNLDPEAPFPGEGVFIENCSRLTCSRLDDLLDHDRYAYPSLAFFLDEAQRATEPLQHRLVTFLEKEEPNGLLILSLIDDEDLDEPLRQRLYPLRLEPPPRAEAATLLSDIWRAEGGGQVPIGLIEHIVDLHLGVPRKCINALSQCLIGGISDVRQLLAPAGVP